MNGLVLAAALWTGFLNPPLAARPWCYWWWINGHVDRETITADLESMKRLGFGGVLMFDSRGYWDDDNHVRCPPADIGFMSDAWFDFVEFSIRECARLGLEFTMNASASGGTLSGFRNGEEYEVNIADAAAVRAHLDAVIGPLCARVPELVGTTFTHIYSVSWEGTVPKGQDPKVRDDLIYRNFYCTMRDWAHGRGFRLYSESGGPWSRDSNHFAWSDQLKFLSVNDMPQGEFWVHSRESLLEGRKDHCRAAVAAAHLYGKPRASAEAFTHMLHHWSVEPSWLKGVGDEAFADGINHFVWHTYTCSPKKFGVPGAEYFAGTHINRNVTWHGEAGGFIGYLGRCQYMLQRGQSVIDFAVWAGDRPYQHTKHYLERPFDTAASRIPRGCTYDLVSDHALVSRFEAKNRRIVLPDGMSYSALILDPQFPSDPVAPVTQAKIDALKMAGVPILMATDAAGIASAAVPDADGPFRATHRRDGETDIYFVIGEGRADMVFRESAHGRTVEIWDAVSATRHAAECEMMTDGRTRVRLDLAECGSCFVVFGGGEPALATEVRAPIPTVEVRGPWRVSFAYPEGITEKPPEPMVFPELDFFVGRPKLRYFSGTATYEADATLGGATLPTRLSLGKIHFGLAHVWVNDVDCGTVWCAPWTVDVSKAVRFGVNKVVVKYVNNWRNRLIGDCLLPPEKRVTQSTVHYWTKPRAGNLIWLLNPSAYSGYSVSDRLEEDGLSGPVEFER